MKIGAHLSTVREHIQTNSDFANTIKQIAAMGYEAVEICSVNSEILPPAELAETCEAYGLEIVGTHVDPLRILNETETVIQEHKLMKAKFIGLETMPEKYPHIKFGFRGFMTDFIPASRAIKEAGLRLMYNNKNFEFEKHDGLIALDYMADKFIDVGFALSTFWTQAGGGDPAFWIKKLAGKASVVHLMDMTVINGKQGMCEVMEGNLNWDSIFSAAKDAKVEYAMVRQDRCYGRDPFKCLRTSLKNIKEKL